VDVVSPVLLKFFTLAAAVPTWTQGPAPDGARWTMKPVSLKELSVQKRSIRLEERAVALSPVGAIGIVAGVVALAEPEYAPPAVLNAWTR
jgi:hypothetical protein